MMHRHIFSSLLLFCCVGGLWNCSSSGTSQLVKKSPFTRPVELSKISAKPVSEGLLNDDGLRVESWDLKGPFPNKIGLAGMQGTPDEFEAALLEAVAQSSNKELRASESMGCAAREMGTFLLEHDMKYPSQSIMDFIRHRCGSISSELLPNHSYWELDSGQTLTLDRLPDNFFTELTDTLKKTYAKAGPVEVGIWFGQREGKAVMQIVAGRRSVHIRDIPMVPMTGDVLVVEGEVLVSTNRLGAMITQGTYESQRCVMDSKVVLPKFRATCPISAADSQAVFAIYNQREESIFSSEIFSQKVWPAGIVSARYQSSPLRELLTAVDISGLSNEAAYLAYINAARAGAGLDPVTLDAPQTLSVQALVPHLFEARREDDEKESGKIAMGLMAGWEIKADIVDADFQMRSCSDGTILSLMESALSSPSGRATFLDKDGDVFAMGEVREGDNLGAMMLMYKFLPEETYIRRIARAWRTVNRERKLSKKKSIKRSKKMLSQSEEIAKKMSDGTMSYDKGVETLQNTVSFAYGNGTVYSFSYFTHDLDDFSLHPELMDFREAEAVLMVAPLNIPDYPWTIYAVVMVVPTVSIKK